MIAPTPPAQQGSGGVAATDVATAGSATQQRPHTPPRPTTGPTIWGLDPSQLHDRFWASRGVQVVRPGEMVVPLADRAPFYLLMEPKALAIFDPATAEEALSMVDSQLMYIRVHDTREHGPRERVVTDANNRFLRFERLYDRPHTHIA